MDEAAKEGIPETLLVLITLHSCVCLAIVTVEQTLISSCLGVKWRPKQAALLSHEVFIIYGLFSNVFLTCPFS